MRFLLTATAFWEFSQLLAGARPLQRWRWKRYFETNTDTSECLPNGHQCWDDMGSDIDWHCNIDTSSDAEKCRINHSCHPNTHHRWDAGEGKKVLYCTESLQVAGLEASPNPHICQTCRPAGRTYHICWNFMRVILNCQLQCNCVGRWGTYNFLPESAQSWPYLECKVYLRLKSLEQVPTFITLLLISQNDASQAKLSFGKLWILVRLSTLCFGG